MPCAPAPSDTGYGYVHPVLLRGGGGLFARMLADDILYAHELLLLSSMLSRTYLLLLSYSVTCAEELDEQGEPLGSGA